MSDFVFITLDTTPPTLSLGVATGFSPSETLQIPFTPGDDATGATAVLRDSLSREWLMTIAGRTASFLIPNDFYEGDYTIAVTVVDDVGNQNTVSTVVHISGTAPPQSEVGGARPPSLIPLRKRPKPLVEEHLVETIIPVVVWCVKTFELSIPVEVGDAKVVEFSADMSIDCAKEFEMAVPVTRQPGLYFAQILNEDEELLLLS